MAPEIPRRDVEPRRHGLARAANLPVHGQPAGVTDRPGRRDLGAKALGERARKLQVLRPFDAASDRHDAVGLRQVDGLPGFANRGLGMLSNLG